MLAFPFGIYFYADSHSKPLLGFLLETKIPKFVKLVAAYILDVI